MEFARHAVAAILGCAVVTALPGCGSLAPISPQQHAAEADMDAGREAFGHGHYEIAIASYAKACAFYSSSGNLRPAAISLLDLAVVYREMGRPKAAEECLDKLDSLCVRAPEAELADLHRESEWFRAVLAVDAGDTEAASRYLETARAGASANLRTRIAAVEKKLSPLR